MNLLCCFLKKDNTFSFVFKILKGSLFFSFLFFIFINASLTSNQILDLASDRFGEIPGINYNRLYLLNRKSKSRLAGHFFEIETAICLNDFYDENVIGLNLDVIISDTLNNSVVEVMTFDSNVILTTTEYDVITDKYLIECKSGTFKARQNRAKQFFKERNLIEWFKVLKQEIISGTLSYRIDVNRKGKKILVVNGISTFGKDVCLMSTWFKKWYKDDYYDFWTDIINLISKRELFLIFKKGISFQSKKFLLDKGFEFEDNFYYTRLASRI
jgi:hypothetical protein